jgi:hypothetical protein
MNAIAETLDVARSNLAERTAAGSCPRQRKGRPPFPEAELVAAIKLIIAELRLSASLGGVAPECGGRRPSSTKSQAGLSRNEGQ